MYFACEAEAAAEALDVVATPRVFVLDRVRGDVAEAVRDVVEESYGG